MALGLVGNEHALLHVHYSLSLHALLQRYYLSFIEKNKDIIVFLEFSSHLVEISPVIE